jgi:predicted dehydrogenase
MRQFRHACELVRNGRLGRLHTIKVGCPGGRVTGPHPPQPVPKGLDWDRWLGPAREVPYTPARRNAGSWYFISDYAASGFIAGWGIHHVDIAQWALDADRSGPVTIEGTGVLPPDGLYDTPVTWHIDCTYANGVKLDFRDNGQNRQGIRFEGTEGWVHADRQTITAEPKSLLTSVIRSNEVRLPRWDNDDRNFLECVKSRTETASPVEAAHRSTAVCYLGHIAILLGRKLQWDPAAERFVGAPEADRLLSRPMRPPWRLT